MSDADRRIARVRRARLKQALVMRLGCWTNRAIPPPGSYEAKSQGCTCREPIQSYDPRVKLRISQTCKVHAWDERRAHG